MRTFKVRLGWGSDWYPIMAGLPQDAVKKASRIFGMQKEIEEYVVFDTTGLTQTRWIYDAQRDEFAR